MSVCSTEESDGEEPIGSKLSFMELLAAVGQSAPHPNRRLEFSPFHPDTSSTELDVEGESALADSDKGNLSPVSQHVYDQHFDGGDQWRERDHTFIDSPLGGHLESDDLIAELPEDGGVLYDYDYPISDTERRKSPPPEVQTVPLDAEGAPPSWKKRKRHGKGDVVPNCRKSTGMGAVEIA